MLALSGDITDNLLCRTTLFADQLIELFSFKGFTFGGIARHLNAFGVALVGIHLFQGLPQHGNLMFLAGRVVNQAAHGL